MAGILLAWWLSQQTPLPKAEERIEVIAVTPVHGSGLPRHKVPANVQVLKLGEDTTHSLDVPTLLADRLSGVQTSEAQGGMFQPDVLFRAFSGSPLLGASEGLAVYQDGVRINDPFGDTVQWDQLPVSAIASVNVMPGSNPLFGLNALGGAISIQTNNGFQAPGHAVLATAGSFGRRSLDIRSGAHARSFAYFLAGSVIDESGWRDHSPSTIRRMFGDAAWRRGSAAVNLSVTAASNNLTGNGAAPSDLLRADHTAVFTHPDRTANDTALITVRAQGQLSDALLWQTVAYHRRSLTGTFNGDAAGDDESGFDAVNNISRNSGRAWGGTTQLTWAGSLRGGAHHLVVGAGFDRGRSEFEFDAELAMLTADRGTAGTGLFDDDDAVRLQTRVTTGSVFLSNTWSLNEFVAVSGAARFNRTSLRLRDRIGSALSGDHQFQRVNPSAGVTVQVHPWVNVYVGYAASSRVPTPVELTCADPEDPCRLPNAFVSDPPLKQVVAATWEAGARKISGGLQWSIAAFHTAADDDIIFVSSGTRGGEGHFENVGRTLRCGIEVSAGYESTAGAVFSASYAFQHATYEADVTIASPFHPYAEQGEILARRGSRLPSVPAHAARASANTDATRRLSAGLSLRLQSGQFLRGDEANSLPPVPGLVVAHADVRVRLSRNIALSAQVHNVLGNRFYTFGALADPALATANFGSARFYSPGAPRAAWIGVSVGSATSDSFD